MESETKRVTDVSDVTVSQERLDTLIDGIATANRTARRAVEETIALQHAIIFSAILVASLYVLTGKGAVHGVR